MELVWTAVFNINLCSIQRNIVSDWLTGWTRLARIESLHRCRHDFKTGLLVYHITCIVSLACLAHMFSVSSITCYRIRLSIITLVINCCNQRCTKIISQLNTNIDLKSPYYERSKLLSQFPLVISSFHFLLFSSIVTWPQWLIDKMLRLLNWHQTDWKAWTSYGFTDWTCWLY